MGILLTIWSNLYFQSLLKILLIIVLAGIIGRERDNLNKPAGFRIYTLLGLSAVLVVLCGEFLSKRYSIDPFRIAAQFLSAIGFIGAGTILRDGFNVKGLTTASGLFTVSCIGLCVGAGFYLVAIVATFVTYLILSNSEKFDHFETIEVEVETKDEISTFMFELDKISDRYELELQKIEDITEEDNEYNSLRIVYKYNSKTITKNKIFTELAAIQNLSNVNEVIH